MTLISDNTLFANVNEAETIKARMVASLLLLSVCASICSGLIKVEIDAD